MHAFTDIHADFHPQSDSQHADSVICDILGSSLGGLGFPFWEKTEMCDMHGRLEYVNGVTLQHICNTLDANQGYCLFHYLSKIWVI
jgi:hypothetical protein